MNEHVGVNLKEGVALSPIGGISTVIHGLIGTFERGPVGVATLVTSFPQFVGIFGSVPASSGTSWLSVKAYFASAGNGSLYIVRAVDPDTAAKATYTFNDSDSHTALKVESANEGAWGNSLSVQVVDDSILSTTLAENADASAITAQLTSIAGLEVGSDVKFYNGTNTEYIRITQIDYNSNTIYWTGGLANAYTTANGVITSREFKLVVFDRSVQVEEWTGLSMNSVVSFYAEKAVTSKLITCTDVLVTHVGDENDQLVAIAAATLASGNDGLSGITGSDYVGVQADKTGVYALDSVPELFRFCCPNPVVADDEALQSLTQSMIDYANSRVTVSYFTEPPFGSTVAEVVTWANKFEGRLGQMFWPGAKVIDDGLKYDLHISGFALGAAAHKDYTVGVHKSIGNEKVPWAYDLEYDVSDAECDLLTDAGVNTVRKMTGGGIRIYGGRTLSAVTKFRYSHVSELWNYVGKSLSIALRDAVFQPNDQTLWKGLTRRISNFLSNLQTTGAIYGGWKVVMDEDNNPQDQIALGLATVEVEYVPVGTVEKLVVKVTSSPGGMSTVS